MSEDNEQWPVEGIWEAHCEHCGHTWEFIGQGVFNARAGITWDYSEEVNLWRIVLCPNCGEGLERIPLKNVSQEA